MLLADINGDAWPDLYEVNYLQGDNVYGLICNRGGKSRSCSPNEFAAQQDRLFLSQADGRFVEWTTAAGLVVPHGKGLGIVAADFDGSGRLGLFLANDMTANTFFVNRAPRGASPACRSPACSESRPRA